MDAIMVRIYSCIEVIIVPVKYKNNGYYRVPTQKISVDGYNIDFQTRPQTSCK